MSPPLSNLSVTILSVPCSIISLSEHSDAVPNATYSGHRESSVLHLSLSSHCPLMILGSDCPSEPRPPCLGDCKVRSVLGETQAQAGLSGGQELASHRRQVRTLEKLDGSKCRFEGRAAFSGGSQTLSAQPYLPYIWDYYSEHSELDNSLRGLNPLVSPSTRTDCSGRSSCES